MSQTACEIIANETYVYCVPTKRSSVVLNDVDDILLSAAASKCFSKLTNVTTDDHVPATGRLDTECRTSSITMLIWYPTIVKPKINVSRTEQ